MVRGCLAWATELMPLPIFIIFFFNYINAYQLQDRDGEGQAGSPLSLVATPVCRRANGTLTSGTIRDHIAKNT